MKTEWSSSWISSVQPRKQRKYVHNAPNHVRQKLLSVHLAPALRKKLNRRSLVVRKGDEIKVMRGGKKGVKGKVSRVNTKKGFVFITGVTRDKVNGNKIEIPFRSSNLMITDTIFDDRYRTKITNRKKGIEVKTEAKKIEKAEEKPKAETKKAEEKPTKPEPAKEKEAPKVKTGPKEKTAAKKPAVKKETKKPESKTKAKTTTKKETKK